MSTAAERARAKAARLTAGTQTSPVLFQEEARPVASPVSSPLPVSTKPIRISLDLAPALFDQLTQWRTRAARQLGQGRVTNADALRVLVRLLVSDEELTAAVIAALRRDQAG
jgi:hypothetical protein